MYSAVKNCEADQMETEAERKGLPKPPPNDIPWKEHPHSSVDRSSDKVSVVDTPGVEEKEEEDEMLRSGGGTFYIKCNRSEERISSPSSQGSGSSVLSYSTGRNTMEAQPSGSRVLDAQEEAMEEVLLSGGRGTFYCPSHTSVLEGIIRTSSPPNEEHQQENLRTFGTRLCSQSTQVKPNPSGVDQRRTSHAMGAGLHTPRLTPGAEPTVHSSRRPASHGIVISDSYDPSGESRVLDVLDAQEEDGESVGCGALDSRTSRAIRMTFSSPTTTASVGCRSSTSSEAEMQRLSDMNRQLSQRNQQNALSPRHAATLHKKSRIASPSPKF